MADILQGNIFNAWQSKTLGSSHQFNDQCFLIAQVRQLLSKLFGHDKLLPTRISSITTNSSYHVPMRQKPTPATENTPKLVMFLLLHNNKIYGKHPLVIHILKCKLILQRSRKEFKLSIKFILDPWYNFFKFHYWLYPSKTRCKKLNPPHLPPTVTDKFSQTFIRHLNSNSSFHLYPFKVL